MGIAPPSFESKDTYGVTEQYTVVVTTSVQTVPYGSDKRIEEVLIVAGDNGDRLVLASFDGDNFIPIPSYGHLIWSLKSKSNGDAFTEIYLKSNTDTCTAYVVVNFS